METTSNIPSDIESSIDETITDLEEAMEAEVAAAIAATQEHAATSPELSQPSGRRSRAILDPRHGTHAGHRRLGTDLTTQGGIGYPPGEPETCP